MKPDSKSEKIPEFYLADLSDEELVRRWKDGNEEAAEVLAERYTLRLVALVASKLNQRYRDASDPEDIVQSAFGSFFAAAANDRVQVSNSLSLWRLLATFARRKMSKTIEKQGAIKRGAGKNRVSLDSADQIGSGIIWEVAEQESAAKQLIDEINAELPENLQCVLRGLLAGRSQKEISAELNVDERTVRRHVEKIRTTFSPKITTRVEDLTTDVVPTSLSRVNYSEFVLGKLVGTGGYGKVYRASMQNDGSIVAVKFLRKGFWHSLQARQSFLREIEIASQIHHVNIIRYFGWGESPHGAPFVISQWKEGKTLLESRSATPEVFCDYLKQICKAIGEVHRMGIVHGDLTPSNILIDRNNQITVTDFGFSQRFQCTNHGAESDTVSVNHLLGGTVGFAAPEQFSSAFGTISRRSDLYALGAIAYWYLTGRPPHQSNWLDTAIGNTISKPEVEFDAFESDAKVEGSTLINSIQRFAKAALRKAVAERPDNVLTLVAALFDS